MYKLQSVSNEVELFKIEIGEIVIIKSLVPCWQCHLYLFKIEYLTQQLTEREDITHTMGMGVNLTHLIY